MNDRKYEIIEHLTAMLGASGVLHESGDCERYRRDWAGHELGAPLAVVRPKNTEEVAQVVGFCHEHRVCMVPQGGHTGLVKGALPDSRYPEVVISLERMTRIRHIDPLNFSMAVDSGCILEQVKRVAEEHDCFFPLSLGAQGSCQIGGNIATNAGGVNVLRYGMMRELVLGMEVVLPNGEIWNGMQALHKDNRGYNLQQLFLGSEGTLGIVTGAVLKLSPRPEQSQTALLALPSVEAAVRLYAQARRACSDLLSAFELIPRQCMELAFEASPQLSDPLDTAYPHYVLLELDATGPVDLAGMLEHLLEASMESEVVLDGVLASSGQQADQLWLIRESMVEGQLLRGEHLRTDVSVPISAISRCVEQATAAVSAIEPKATTIAYGHIGDGNLHINVLPPADMAKDQLSHLLGRLETAIFEVVDRCDGSISAEHGIGRSKQEALLARSSETELKLLAGIKAVFDPHHLMGAGRILPSTGEAS
ncbi:FAD-binding oxidoreductase [Halomonas sp. EGI 63088]|uniref:FAD-binding oxidoreductase n=1 Tax=Halomonas flagellata TaxID=2920385 RepID=A0ABS9RQJ9_9GAMM|nr:FAD-binding oxidoreductase [Halomonas flagellata]MCH4562115.1 FAD-binding oxidoreductase [Halomonas flagellata]